MLERDSRQSSIMVLWSRRQGTALRAVRVGLRPWRRLSAGPRVLFVPAVEPWGRQPRRRRSERLPAAARANAATT